MLELVSTDIGNLSLFLAALIVAIIALMVTRRLLRVSFPYFFMGIVGLILGLIAGSLVATPLSKLPGEFGRWLPVVVNIFVAVGMLDLFIAQTKPVAQYIERVWSKTIDVNPSDRQDILIDTSALIDGRIEQLVETGFVNGTLVIPQFVLAELQKIADSSDSLKRVRGRRGLDVVRRLKQNANVVCEISPDRLVEKDQVDEKLVRLARRRGLRLMTLDFNLAQVAQIQSVIVLNINQLATALKPLLVPGEQLVVKVTQRGKEKGQGVGYLDDGTMIVVEGGDKHVGQEIECEVVRLFQTITGKIIFVVPKGMKLKNKVDWPTGLV